MKTSRFAPAVTAAVVALAGATPSLAAVPSEVVAQARAAIDADTPRLTTMFKDIHQYLELGFMETRTAAIVAKELKALGFTVTTSIGSTGVVGVLRNGDGPVVMYRADMDANAVEEATGLPWASKVCVKRSDGAEVPVGHMCGHDAHVHLDAGDGQGARWPEIKLAGHGYPRRATRRRADHGCTSHG